MFHFEYNVHVIASDSRLRYKHGHAVKGVFCSNFTFENISK